MRSPYAEPGTSRLSMGDENEPRFVVEVRGQHNVLLRREGEAADPNPVEHPRVDKLNDAIEDALSDLKPYGGEVKDDYREEIFSDGGGPPNWV